MSFSGWHIILFTTLAVTVGLLYAVNRYLRPFFWRITACFVPLALAGLVVASAVRRYEDDGGGFKLGVDLVGGTILVYEVDTSKQQSEYKPEQLAEALKRRIDPNDLKNVTIRPVSNTRVEIILPTGGLHQAQIEDRAWKELINEVSAQWPPPPAKDLDVGLGQVPELVNRVRDQHTEAKIQDIEDFIALHYKTAGGRKDVTGEEIQHTKELISQVGSLEFRILANEQDDGEALKAGQAYMDNLANKPELERLALAGKPPPPPVPSEGKGVRLPPRGILGFPVDHGNLKGNFTYSWIELGKEERRALNLDNAAKDDPARSAEWKRFADNRGKALIIPSGQRLVYSRVCQDLHLPPELRKAKAIEYFMLTRDPEIDRVSGQPKAVTGSDLASAKADLDQYLKPNVSFHFNTRGGDLFYDLTSKNAPMGSEGSKFERHLAIVLDGQIMSDAVIRSAIRTDGQITGNFTQKKVDDIVSILRAGALPATLKSQPVSENTMSATLGAETIMKGEISVGFAFAAILLFMLVYYRFAGLVACIALMANLLLTIAFMVLVSATFTLPGLAGLVLMLGMAVDANVLIYERLREERDRGASLALSIRNGYDRAFPTIIDTHLSSIFTAIVLYAVGNDQLKGFGVSLTVGLFISLFTSLYMTRLLFDLWLARNWLHKLSMFKLFSRPNIDFMSIRYYWFTATILLTIFGITVFVLRLPDGLNIDFNGGTAYGGELTKPMELQALRSLLDEKAQKERLQVDSVTEISAGTKPAYEIIYRDSGGGQTKRLVHFANLPSEDTVEKRQKKVKEWAEQLPDLTVEQIFPGFGASSSGGSHLFTVRTSEKERELVEASISRLLGDKLKRIEMEKYEISKDGKHVELTFVDPQRKDDVYASPGQVSMLLEREFQRLDIQAQFGITGEGKNSQGRFGRMRIELTEPVNPPSKLAEALAATQREFAERPQPDRLENFDSQLAAETQQRAMYAILASWSAILLYLWFRFGSWTFGLATVLCLIHDLFFTLGIIAFCHYIHQGMPGLASALLIQDFKIDLPAVAALLTLVGYSTNDTIVVFDRIREVRGKNPELTPQMINDSVNQTLSRTLLTSFSVWLVVIVLYLFGGEGVHLFAFVMVIGVIVGTYSSIYIASPLLLIFGEGRRRTTAPVRQPVTATV
jgi:SecD/SecF fusion protein